MTETKKKDPAEAEKAEGEEKKRYESAVETVGPCKVELRITAPAETVKEEFDSRYKEIISTVAFPGFRIGHAPRRLVEKKLGDDVKNDVKEHILSESFKEAIEEHDLEPISEPDVDLSSLEIDPDTPLEYQTTLVVRPTVEIPDYEKISVKAVKPEVPKEKVEEVLTNIRREHAVLEPAEDGKVAEGDVAIVDVLARVEGEKLLERENVEYEHPAGFLAGLPLAGVAKAILGKSGGDELTVSEKLPETWPNPEQAGKELTAEIKIQDVKRHVLPELDEEFAKEMDFDSVEELREEVEEQVERQAEHEARDATDRLIVDSLIEAAPFELPEDVVKEEITQRLDRTQALLRMRGASEEEVERKLAESRVDERTVVEREFRSGFLLDAIAKKEKVFVTENEVKDRIAQMAASYHRSPEEMEEYLEQRNLTSSVRGSMREEKVMELLRKKVKIEGEA
ncbi:MAG: trigger factor [Planctomycetota bacterium]|jgi:trigger factor